MPSYQQRQIVEVEFRLPPDGDSLKHPAIILSNTTINEDEQAFVAIMMTSKNHDDEYSFVVDNAMVSKPFDNKEHREIRLHLIGHFLYDDIIKNTQGLRFLKEDQFKRLIYQMNEITFEFKL